jgi:hypothetical protein
MSDFKRGQAVKVFMGAGWAKGTFIRCTGVAHLVQLPDRVVAVYDPRNIR